MTIDEFVAGLAEILGKPAQWEDDTLSLVLADKVTATLEYDRGTDILHLYADIARVEERVLARLSQALLEANLYAAETGGAAVFGYDRDEERVILWDKFPLAGLGDTVFRVRFEAFVGVALHWSENLYRGDGADGGSDLPPITTPGMRA